MRGCRSGNAIFIKVRFLPTVMRSDASQNALAKHSQTGRAKLESARHVGLWPHEELPSDVHRGFWQLAGLPMREDLLSRTVGDPTLAITGHRLK